MDEVRFFLSSAWDAEFAYRRSKRKVAELEERCQNITANWNGMPGGGGDVHKDDTLNALADWITRRDEWNRELSRREAEVERFLDNIPDDRHRAILKLRYVDRMSWPKVLVGLRDAGYYYEERNVFKLHGKALNSARELWADWREKAKWKPTMHS